MARAGAVTYEPGTSMLDESVLVYLVRSRGYSAGFDVVDHVDRPRGSSNLSGHRRLYKDIGTTVLTGTDGTRLLTVTPGPGRYGTPFDVSGAVSARLVAAPPPFGNGMDVLVNNEPAGSLVGCGPGGVIPPRVTVQDHTGRRVAVLTSFRRRRLGSRAADYVLAVEPRLTGELRPVMVAAPLVLASFSQVW